MSISSLEYGEAFFKILSSKSSNTGSMSAWVPPAAWWPGGRGGWGPWRGDARRTRGATPEPAALRTPPHTPLGTRGQTSAFFVILWSNLCWVLSERHSASHSTSNPSLHFLTGNLSSKQKYTYFMTNSTSLNEHLSNIPWQSRRQWSEPSSAARWTLGWPQCQSPRWPRQRWQPRPRPAERGPHPPSRKTWLNILKTSISKTSIILLNMTCFDCSTHSLRVWAV